MEVTARVATLPIGCKTVNVPRAIDQTVAINVPKLIAALRAVEALHVPDDDNECPGCRAECMYCEADHPWPCPPIIAIRDALT
jgi:hypothetical protein